MAESLILFGAALAAFIVSAIVPLALPPGRARSKLSASAMILGGLLCAVAALVALHASEAPGLSIAESASPLLRFGIRIDALAAFGLLGLALVSTAVAWACSSSYSGDERADRRGLASLAVLFLSIALVVTSAQSVTFLIAWETMSLAGFFLVLSSRHDEEAQRAAVAYFVMAHITGALLFVAFAALYAITGSFEFAAYSQLAPSALASAAFVAALAGLAIKAGLIPLHGWLPGAYAASPAPASAAMSGIMSKMAVLIALRFVVQFLAPGPLWWGLAMMALGVFSALLGVLYALQEDDIKRLLAFSSIENLGLVFTALGLGEVLLATGRPALALLAWAVGLLHALNHAAFKSLLFLAAGAVERATGTRSLNRLGGLATRMPWTTVTFLVGAMAIAALPPLNGFVSEWLLYQTLVATIREVPGVGLAAAAAGAVALLALVAGLAVATFVKAQGVVFHGLPRSVEAASARDPPRSSLAPMVFLAASCVGLALAGPGIVQAIELHLAPSVPTASLATSLEGPSALFVADQAVLAPLATLGVLLFFGALVALVVGRRARSGAGRRIEPPWACGARVTRPRATYSGLAMGKALGMMFSTILLPQRVLQRTSAPGDPSRSRVSFRTAPTPLFERALYDPVVTAVQLASARLRRLQAGSVQVYVAYILVVVLVLLVFLTVTA